ncbi:hypothetical protein ACJX0J_028705, partial [Zea mays]
TKYCSIYLYNIEWVVPFIAQNERASDLLGLIWNEVQNQLGKTIKQIIEPLIWGCKACMKCLTSDKLYPKFNNCFFCLFSRIVSLWIKISLKGVSGSKVQIEEIQNKKLEKQQPYTYITLFVTTIAYLISSRDIYIYIHHHILRNGVRYTRTSKLIWKNNILGSYGDLHPTA